MTDIQVSVPVDTLLQQADPQAVFEHQKTQLWQGRLDGKISQDQYLERMEALQTRGPVPLGQLVSPAAAPPAPVSNPAEIRSQMDQLVSDRMAGKIDQAKYLDGMSRLGEQLGAAQAAQAKPADRNGALHIDPDVQAQLDRMMAPGKPEEYDLPPPGQNPEDIEDDRVSRQMLADLSVPTALGGEVSSRIETLAEQLQNALPGKIEAHYETFRKSLTDEWGAETPARVAIVDEFILKAAQKNQHLAHLLDSTPYAFADVQLVKHLYGIAAKSGRAAS